MAQVGRPSKLTEDKIQTAIKLAEENKPITYICKFLNINHQTYYNWCEQYPQLKKRIDQEKKAAEKKELEKVKKSLVKRALGYKTKEVKELYDGNGNKTGKVITTKEVPADVKAQTLYLTNRDPENWKLQPDDNNDGNNTDNTLHIIID